MYNQFIPIWLLNKQIKSYIFVKLYVGQSITYEIPFINRIKLRMKWQKPNRAFFICIYVCCKIEPCRLIRDLSHNSN